jgi:predicted Zn-dependent protease with MMP-like domain
MDELFNKYVSDAIDHIPKVYEEKMKHVAIIVEDMPTEEQRSKLGLRRCDALFGLYEGVPLPKRGGNTLQLPPDVITIFRRPMVDIFTEPDTLKKQIYETLWHEVAHFFGLNHSQIHKAKRNK